MIYLIDLDGVTVNRADFFSNRARDLYPTANHEAIKDFFVGGEYKKTALGEIELKESLNKVLPSWNTGVDTNTVLNDWFNGENEINQGAINKIQKLRKTGHKCVIVTDHSEYRKNDVWGSLGMKDYFDGVIASSDLGFTKDKPEFFTKTLERLNISDVGEVAFIDDDPENVAVAESVGIKSVVYQNVESFDKLTK